MEAGAEDANLIICVTTSDELNILAGLMAKKMGTRHTIARVRNPGYSSQRDFMRNQLHKITKTNILICAVSHNEDVIIPDGNYAIKPGNHLYITGTHRDLSRFYLDIGVITNRIKNVIIVGGGKIAYYLSKQLSTQGIKVKIIEKDKNRCQILAEKLPYVTIIHGDGSDDELLNEEGIENTDAVLALTGLDEENIVLSLSAKSLYHKKTIAKVTRMNYTGLSDVLKVDSIVAPKKIVASQIIRYVRAKMTKDHDSAVKTLYKIVDGEVEAVEFKVTEHFNYLLILSCYKIDFTSAFSAVATCLNNVGPGMNVVGPVGNFSSLSDVSKLVLSFDMLAGRLEIFPMLLLFAPSQWRK